MLKHYATCIHFRKGPFLSFLEDINRYIRDLPIVIATVLCFFFCVKPYLSVSKRSSDNLGITNVQSTRCNDKKTIQNQVARMLVAFKWSRVHSVGDASGVCYIPANT